VVKLRRPLLHVHPYLPIPCHSVHSVVKLRLPCCSRRHSQGAPPSSVSCHVVKCRHPPNFPFNLNCRHMLANSNHLAKFRFVCAIQSQAVKLVFFRDLVPWSSVVATLLPGFWFPRSWAVGFDFRVRAIAARMAPPITICVKFFKPSEFSRVRKT